MISLFGRTRTFTPDLLKVPSYCVPCQEAEGLRPKREAQLEWMRKKGVRYLGSPAERVERKTKPPVVTVRSARVVEIRSERELIEQALRQVDAA